MATLTDLRKKFDKAKIKPALEQAFNENAVAYADLNRKQLKLGKNKAGDTFGPYQDEFYATEKNKKNPLPGFGNPDYILTGDFAREIDAVLKGDTISVTSHDAKTYKIEQREFGLGGDPNLIFGVSSENKKVFQKQNFTPSVKKILDV